MATHETNLKAVFTLVDRMSPALKQMQREMRVAGRNMRSGFESLAKGAGFAMTGLTALAGTGAGVWAATLSASETAVELKKMSDQTGVAVEQLQAWQTVAESAGMDSQEFAESLRDMNIELSDAATGGKDELAQLLKRVGIEARDASGHIKTADQVFLDFADAVARQKDEAIQLRMAISAFGEDTGAKLLPILRQGSEAFKNAEAAMTAAGNALSDSDIARMQAFRGQWATLAKSFDRVRIATLGSLAPAFGLLTEKLQAVFEKLQPIISARMDEWAERLTTWLEGVDWDAFVSGIDALLAGGDKLEKEFGVVGKAINFVSDNLGTLLTGIVSVQAAFGAWKIGTAFVSITKGVAGVLQALDPKLVLTQLAKWGTGFVKFAQVAWGALAFLGKAFLKTGPIGWALTAFSVFSLAWQKWGDDIMAVANSIWEGIKGTFDAIGDWINEKVDGIMATFAGLTDSLEGVVPKWLMNLFSNDSPQKTISIDVKEDVARAMGAGDFYRNRDGVQGEGNRNAPSMDFYRTRGDFSNPRVVQVVTQPQFGEMRGRLDVNFANAQPGTRITRSTSDGMALNTSIRYAEGSGRGVNAPSW